MATGLVIQPYRKNTKILLSGMITRSDVIQNEVTSSLFPAKVRNFLCMAQCSLSNSLLMWVGWNSTLFATKSPNKSPTSVAVVAETLKRFQEIAEENLRGARFSNHENSNFNFKKKKRI